MTVDWATGIVTIPQGDLDFVSGTFYTSDTNSLRILMKTLESSEIGIVFPDISRHNTEVGPIVGTVYARTIEIINSYTLTFSPDSAWSVQLEDSNNNMWDIGGGVLNQNQVQVIPTNSAGLQVVTSGSGVLPGDVSDIADAVWDEGTAAHNIAASFGEMMAELQLKIDELHKLQGLQNGFKSRVDKPNLIREVDNTSIKIDIENPSEGVVEMERQP